jgi:hypothetical protein
MTSLALSTRTGRRGNDQLTNLANPGLFLGSVLHVGGLTAAVAGGARMVVDRRAAGERGR